MKVTLFKDAEPYAAKNHFEMTAMRLQGGDASPLEDFWVGMSTFLPGGGADWGSSPTGKVYMVITGHVSVKFNDQEIELGPNDSLYLEPNEERSVLNKRNEAATMIVVST